MDFDNVSFAYSGRRPVLSEFDLHIRAGERVGLIGPSGAGKSTIFALIQHFYEPQTGSVRISGQDISRVTLHSLQTAISIVPQDASLFHRSLLDNIRYGVPDATEADVRRACEDANCMDFLAACQGASTPLPATAAQGCRAVNARESPSRELFSRTRLSFCSTKPLQRSTRLQNSPSSQPLNG